MNATSTGYVKRVAVLLLAIWLGAWNGYADAATCTSYRNGDWNSSNTWSLILGLLGCGGLIGGIPDSTADVIVSNGDTVTVNISSAAASTVTINSTGTLRFNTAGNSLTSGGTFTNNGTILFNATGTVNVDGDFSSSGTVTNTAAGTINIKGAATVNGTFTPGSGTIAFTGTSNQAVSGSALGFYNVTMNNANGITLGNDLTAGGTLLFTSGNITTGTSKVTVGTAGTVSGAGSTTGYVSGCMEKLYPTGASSFTFTIGDATAYTPVDTSVTATGNLTFCITTPDHPNIGSSSLDPNFTVNRYCSATSSAVPGTYSATFNFLTSDIDQNAAPANFIVQRYVAPTWYDATVGTRMITSTQATGLTAVGDFAIGESRPRPLNKFIYLRENF